MSEEFNLLANVTVSLVKVFVSLSCLVGIVLLANGAIKWVNSEWVWPLRYWLQDRKDSKAREKRRI